MDAQQIFPPTSPPQKEGGEWQTSRHAHDLTPQLAMACIEQVASAKGWTSAVQCMTSELGHALGALRVSLGWFVGGQLRILASSDSSSIAEGAAMPELHQAMRESVHEAVAVRLSHDDAQGPRYQAHQRLCQVQGLASILSVPLLCGGRIRGVVVCERAMPTAMLDPQAMPVDEGQQASAFSAQQQQWLQAFSQAVSPILMLHYRAIQPWYESWVMWWRALPTRLRDPAERNLRAVVGGGLAVSIYLMVWPFTEAVTVDASLEAINQRVVDAPMDAYVQAMHVRPGDIVQRGTLLAQLRNDDLSASIQTVAASVKQLRENVTLARASGPRGRISVAEDALKQNQMHLTLLQQKMQRLQIESPFDGIVIRTAKQTMLGERVPRGQWLFQLSPGLDWRVVLEVPAYQVSKIRKGQAAQLRLNSLPDRQIPLVIEKIIPVPVSDGQQTMVKYEVQATPQGLGAAMPGLRPGLDGIVRIELSERPLLWRWAERSWNWLTMRWWAWS
jgi:Barrel-sandwich domain of CusB or HlyD membrane-fusion/GAF domain